MKTCIGNGLFGSGGRAQETNKRWRGGWRASGEGSKKQPVSSCKESRKYAWSLCIEWTEKKKKKKKNQLCHSSGLWKTSLPPTDTYAQNQNTHFAHRASRFNEHNTFTGIVPLENKWGIVYFSGLHFLFSPAAPKSPKCSEQEDVRWRENKEQGGEIESKGITHETLHKTVISWNILRK